MSRYHHCELFIFPPTPKDLIKVHNYIKSHQEWYKLGYDVLDFKILCYNENVIIIYAYELGGVEISLANIFIQSYPDFIFVENSYGEVGYIHRRMVKNNVVIEFLKKESYDKVWKGIKCDLTTLETKDYDFMNEYYFENDIEQIEQASNYNAISKIAHQIWLDEGKLDGEAIVETAIGLMKRREKHWMEAEASLKW